MEDPNLQAVRFLFIDASRESIIRQIEALYRAQGWWGNLDEGKKDLLPRLIEGSHCFAVAMKDDEIVAMGRAISDGISDAYVQDFTVRQDYRRRGIGSRLLHMILERLYGDGIRWIGLIAEPGSQDFYLKAGFREFRDATPFLMIRE